MKSRDFLNLKFCCFCPKYLYSNDKQRYELLMASKKAIKKKIEIVDILRQHDQFRLLKKLILNENQNFMVNNREVQSVSMSKVSSDKNKEEEKLTKDKQHEENLERLLEYLHARKNENTLTGVDIVLFKYMNEEMKSKIKDKINI